MTASRNWSASDHWPKQNRLVAAPNLLPENSKSPDVSPIRIKLIKTQGFVSVNNYH